MQFKVKCNWLVESIVSVEASSKEEAIEKAHEIETKDFPSPQYVDDTFGVDSSFEVISVPKPDFSDCTKFGCYTGCVHDATKYIDVAALVALNESLPDCSEEKCLEHPCSVICAYMPVNKDPYEIEEEEEKGEEEVPDTVREIPINDTKCIAWENGEMCCEPVFPRAGIRVCYDHLKCGPNDEPINPGSIIPGDLGISDRIVIVRDTNNRMI